MRRSLRPRVNAGSSRVPAERLARDAERDKLTHFVMAGAAGYRRMSCAVPGASASAAGLRRSLAARHMSCFVIKLIGKMRPTIRPKAGQCGANDSDEATRATDQLRVAAEEHGAP